MRGLRCGGRVLRDLRICSRPARACWRAIISDDSFTAKPMRRVPSAKCLDRGFVRRTATRAFGMRTPSRGRRTLLCGASALLLQKRSELIDEAPRNSPGDPELVTIVRSGLRELPQQLLEPLREHEREHPWIGGRIGLIPHDALIRSVLREIYGYSLEAKIQHPGSTIRCVPEKTRVEARPSSVKDNPSGAGRAANGRSWIRTV